MNIRMFSLLIDEETGAVITYYVIDVLVCLRREASLHHRPPPLAQSSLKMQTFSQMSNNFLKTLRSLTSGVSESFQIISLTQENEGGCQISCD